LRKLAQPHFVLKNDARNRRAHGQTINIGFSHLDLSFRLSAFRFRDGNVGSPCARLSNFNWASTSANRACAAL